MKQMAVIDRQGAGHMKGCCLGFTERKEGKRIERVGGKVDWQQEEWRIKARAARRKD